MALKSRGQAGLLHYVDSSLAIKEILRSGSCDQE